MRIHERAGHPTGEVYELDGGGRVMQPRGVARRAGRRFLVAVVVLVALAAIGGTSLVTAGQDQLARVLAATDIPHVAVAKARATRFYVCTTTSPTGRWASTT